MDEGSCIVTERTALIVPINSFQNNVGKETVYKKHGLGCPYSNAQSMGRKKKKLKLLLHEIHKYDLIGITETCWDASHDSNTATGG